MAQCGIHCALTATYLQPLHETPRAPLQTLKSESRIHEKPAPRCSTVSGIAWPCQASAMPDSIRSDRPRLVYRYSRPVESCWSGRHRRPPFSYTDRSQSPRYLRLINHCTGHIAGRLCGRAAPPSHSVWNTPHLSFRDASESQLLLPTLKNTSPHLIHYQLPYDTSSA